MSACSQFDINNKSNVRTFAYGASQQVFDSIPLSGLIKMIDKRLEPILVYVIQSAATSIANMLDKAIDKKIKEVLKQDKVNEIFDECINIAASKSVGSYFLKGHNQMLEASPLWLQTLDPTMEVTCAEPDDEEECQKCEDLKDEEEEKEEESKNIFEMLKDQLFSFFKQIVERAVKRVLNTPTFGQLIRAWTKTECVERKLGSIYEKIALENEEYISTMVGKKFDKWNPNIVDLQKTTFYEKQI